MPKIKLAVDLMGGDHGPQNVASGLIASAVKNPDVAFYAVGLPHVLSQYFAKKPQNIQLVPAEHEITMDMSVAQASKFGPTSSMGTAIAMVKAKQVDACISCGNTSGLMALAFRILKMQKNVRRPAILSSIIFQNRRIYITDLGANLLPKAEDYLANAQVAANYVPIANPRISMINVGIEDTKGTPVVKEAHTLLKESSLNYIGFIEGHDILSKKHDIILSDGFVGNCVTKFMESMLVIFKNITNEPNRLPKLNYAALLAGLNGQVYKAHGHCNAMEIEQAIEDTLNQEQSLLIT